MIERPNLSRKDPDNDDGENKSRRGFLSGALGLGLAVGAGKIINSIADPMIANMKYNEGFRIKEKLITSLEKAVGKNIKDGGEVRFVANDMDDNDGSRINMIDVYLKKDYTVGGTRNLDLLVMQLRIAGGKIHTYYMAYGVGKHIHEERSFDCYSKDQEGLLIEYVRNSLENYDGLSDPKKL